MCYGVTPIFTPTFITHFKIGMVNHSIVKCHHLPVGNEPKWTLLFLPSLVDSTWIGTHPAAGRSLAGQDTFCISPRYKVSPMVEASKIKCEFRAFCADAVVVGRDGKLAE